MKYLSILTFILVILTCWDNISCIANSLSLLGKTKTIRFIKDENEYYLDSQNIIVNSVQVIADGKELTIDTDFQIDYKKGIIKFLRELPDNEEIIVNYKTFGDNIKYHYYLYKPQKILSKHTKYDLEIPTSKRDEHTQGTNLNISGSKSIGISVGNKEDMSLDQSLFLQIDGELSKGLFVEAQLSDNVSPIAPEGTSQKLSNLDKVMIRIYSADHSLTFGDFNILYQDTHFANYQKKLEGAIFRWEGENRADAAVSISTGNSASNKLTGTEGKQGPYYLTPTGQSNEQVRIIAGSETIYLNGEKMQRGSDYTIDYSDGSIIFKNKRLITDNSIIIADFEYSAEDFRSNLYLTSTSYSLANSPLGINISFRMFYDKDDKDNPLNTTFSSTDKSILSRAGDNELLARKDSAVKMDSVGQGNYILVDKDTISYYKYVGYDSTGDYTVSFTYVGEGNGSYNRISIDEFEWVGENMGSYIPKIQLPIPKQNLNIDAGLKFQFGDFSLYSEGIFTNFDKNTFSDIDDNDNKGYAMFHNLKFQKKLPLFQETELGIYYEFKDKYFHPITRIEKSSDEYNLYEFVEVDSVNKAKFGGNTKFYLTNQIENQSSFYYQRMGSMAEMRNLQNRFDYYQNNTVPFLPSVNYQITKIDQEVTEIPNHQSLIIHHLLGKYHIWLLESSAGYDYKRFQSTTNGDTSGWKERNYIYQLGSYKLENTKLSLQYKQENNFDYMSELWQRSKKANTIKSKIYQNWNNTNIQIDFTHRENEYFSSLEKNSKFDLVEAEITNKLWKKLIYNKVNYNIKNLEEYPKVRKLVYVGKGKGLYDSTGTYELGGDYDYEITRIGTPQLTTDLQFDWNLRIEPKQYFYQKKHPLANLMNKFIFDTYTSIYEKSNYPRKLKIYTLSPQILMNENYTIYGSQKYRQQVWYNIRKNRIVSKFFYEKTKRMDNQYENVYDRLWIDNYNLQLDFYNINGWNFKNSIDFRKEKETKYNSISRIYTYTLDTGYRFGYNLLLSNKLEYISENGEEIDGGNDYRIRSYAVEPKITYNIQQKYRVFGRFSYQKNKRTGSDYLSSVMLSKREGIITNWLIQFDYKINKFTTMFFSYNGEKYPRIDTRHQIKMEVRAVF